MILDFILMIVLAVIMHELGHYMYLTEVAKIKPKFKFRWGGIDLYSEKSILRTQHINAIFAGVIFGFVPFLLFSLSDYYMIAGFVAYLGGCSEDFKILWGLRK